MADSLAVAALVVLAIIVVVWPLGATLVAAVTDALRSGVKPPSEAFVQSGISKSIPLFARSLVWTGGIGLLSAALAFPLSFGLAFGPGYRWALLLPPLALPSYLASSGWGLLRAPGTPLGNAIENAVVSSGPWVAVTVNRSLAVGGLALWSVPIAAAVQALMLRGLDPAVLESLRLDTGGLRAAAARFRIGFAAFLVSALLVGVLMLGSAVPLHLAEVRTSAIQVWLALDTTGPGEHWRAWVAAWPLVGTAVIVGWFVGGYATGDEGPRSEPARRDGSAGRWWLVVVSLLAVGIPLALFAWGLRDRAVFMRFPKLAGEAMVMSGPAALVVFATSLLLAILTSWGLSGTRRVRVVTRAVVRLFVVAGLVPGVMIGSAISHAWSDAGTIGNAVGNSFAIIALAHLARFAFLPMLVAAVGVRAEPAAQRSARAIDGATGILGWVRAALPGRLPWLLLASAVAGLMSLQEIESVVIVQPPGETLARMILGFLHYSRTDELCASGLWLGGTCLLLAVLTATLRWDREGDRA